MSELVCAVCKEPCDSALWTALTLDGKGTPGWVCQNCYFRFWHV